MVDLPLSEISTIDWSPEYFIEHFRNEKVTIASNLPMRGDRVKTVGQFFRSFGRQDGFENSEKIKVSFSSKHWSSLSFLETVLDF